MTIIAYIAKDRTLYADSGVVVGFGSPNQRLDTTSKKIYVDPEGTFALAATGYCIKHEQLQSFLNYIMPKIKLFMMKRDPSALNIEYKEHQMHGMMAVRFIITTATDVFIFNADNFSSSIVLGSLDEDVIYGNTAIHIHTAMKTFDMSAMDAIAYGIHCCDYSRLPILSHSVDNLKPIALQEENK